MAETTHAHFDWNTYIELCERLVARVAKSGWQFDSLLCLARGGMRPGDFFSRIYGKPLAIMTTSSYREAAGTVQGDLDIAKYITGSFCWSTTCVTPVKRSAALWRIFASVIRKSRKSALPCCG